MYSIEDSSLEDINRRLEMAYQRQLSDVLSSQADLVMGQHFPSMTYSQLMQAQNPQMTTIMSSYLMGTNHNTENGFQQDLSNPMPLLNIKQEPMATHVRNSDVRGDVNEHLKRMESVLGTGEISNELEFMEGNLHLENENTTIELENDPKGALLSKAQNNHVEPILGLNNFNAVQPQQKMDMLPFTRQQFPEAEQAQVKHPANGMMYQISSHFLATVLDRYGKAQVQYPADSKEILTKVQKFCEARSLGFMTDKDARQIVDSGYPIETISTKKTKCDDSGPFECLFCPLVQNCRKYFGVKENLKRHYSKHLRFHRFACGAPHCSYASYRGDHVKDHIEKKHPNQGVLVRNV